MTGLMSERIAEGLRRLASRRSPKPRITLADILAAPDPQPMLILTEEDTEEFKKKMEAFHG